MLREGRDPQIQSDVLTISDTKLKMLEQLVKAKRKKKYFSTNDYSFMQ